MSPDSQVQTFLIVCVGHPFFFNFRGLALIKLLSGIICFPGLYEFTYYSTLLTILGVIRHFKFKYSDECIIDRLPFEFTFS